MTRILFSIALAILALPAFADPVAGTWRTESNEQGQFLHVQVSECGAKICGVISGAYDRNGTSNASYEHLGTRMIWDMAASGGGQYKGGRIWAPDSGKTYRSKMALSGNALKVSGCVGPICRGQTWTRVR